MSSIFMDREREEARRAGVPERDIDRYLSTDPVRRAALLGIVSPRRILYYLSSDQAYADKVERIMKETAAEALSLGLTDHTYSDPMGVGNARLGNQSQDDHLNNLITHVKPKYDKDIAKAKAKAEHARYARPAAAAAAAADAFDPGADLHAWFDRRRDIDFATGLQYPSSSSSRVRPRPESESRQQRDVGRARDVASSNVRFDASIENRFKHPKPAAAAAAASASTPAIIAHLSAVEAENRRLRQQLASSSRMCELPGTDGAAAAAVLARAQPRR